LKKNPHPVPSSGVTRGWGILGEGLCLRGAGFHVDAFRNVVQQAVGFFFFIQRQL